MNNKPHTSLTVGVLGLGSKSTHFYTMLLNKHYHNVRGGYSTFPFLLLNTDFDTINPYLPNQYDVLEGVLLPYLKQLEVLNIKHLVIPNITIHRTWDRLNEIHQFSYSISHPIQLTIRALRRSGHQKIVLFATLYNMTKGLIKDQFLAAGIEVISIPEEKMIFIDNVRRQVYDGQRLTDSDRNKFDSLLEFYVKKTPVIIACTELSIATMYSKHTNLYDMAKFQITDAYNKFIELS